MYFKNIIFPIYKFWNVKPAVNDLCDGTIFPPEIVLVVKCLKYIEEAVQNYIPWILRAII